MGWMNQELGGNIPYGYGTGTYGSSIWNLQDPYGLVWLVELEACILASGWVCKKEATRVSQPCKSLVSIKQVARLPRYRLLQEESHSIVWEENPESSNQSFPPPPKKLRNKEGSGNVRAGCRKEEAVMKAEAGGAEEDLGGIQAGELPLASVLLPFLTELHFLDTLVG